MSEPRLTSATRELLRAARADGPSAAARAKVWGNVAGSVGAAGAAAGAGASLAPGSAAGAVGAAKMLAIGTLLGGTITVGLAAALLHIGPAPVPAPRAAASVVHASAPVRVPGVLPTPATDPPSVAAEDLSSSPAPAPPPTRPGRPHADLPPGTPHAVPVADDGLAREAVLVAEARGALKRGDPQSCLRSVHAARLLPSHQLGPEELALEAQALQALGRDDEARETDAQLRRLFPESALAR
ncbi:MAG TPA: hypothetical protein VIF09_01480 [Polyangiaceae bacterium]|jgi:hypothetical protein